VVPVKRQAAVLIQLHIVAFASSLLYFAISVKDKKSFSKSDESLKDPPYEHGTIH
jgi:hypothetical protein